MAQFFSSNISSILNEYCYNAICDSKITSFSNKPVRIKIDSCCSKSASGVPNRLNINYPIDKYPPVRFTGFNKSSSPVTERGINSDSKVEYYLESMPDDLVLLCGADYAADGAIIMFKENGFLLKLDELDQQRLLNFILQFKINKKLKVVNNTYEVDTSFSEETSNGDEIAYSSIANTYFNSNIHVSNGEERILACLLTGLSFNDLYESVKHGSISSLPRELNIQILNSFRHKFGTNPSILQLALPNLGGNKKGYMKPSDPIIEVGQLVEGDVMYSEINEDFNIPSESDFNNTSDHNNNTQRQIKKHTYRKKLPSHGQAIASYVYKDVYSGYLNGHLLKTVKTSLNNVKIMNNFFKLYKHKIKSFAADIGVISASDFLVMLPDVVKYLLEELITPINAEGYNHNNGTPHLDADIKQIHQLQRFAFLYILRNPNLKYLKFSRLQILKLWGELFYWAITIINLKQCPNVPGKTRYEVFTGKVPDFREIRILPIFAILYVLRHQNNKELNSTTYYWQQALYVGPSLSVPGCIRAAVVTNKTVQIIITSNIKSISDGGDLNIHKFAVDPLDYPKDTDEYHDEIINHEDKILPFISILKQSADPVATESDCLDILDKSPLESSTYLPVHNKSENNEIDNICPSTKEIDDSETNLQSTKINKYNNDNNNIIINDINTSRSAVTAVRQKTSESSNDYELRGVNKIYNSNNIDRVQNITLSHNLIPFDKVRGDEDAQFKLLPTNSKTKSNSNINNVNNIDKNTSININNKNINKNKRISFAEKIQQHYKNNTNLSRAERLRLRNATVLNKTSPVLEHIINFADIAGIEECLQIDWQEHCHDKYYFSFSHNAYIQILDEDINFNQLNKNNYTDFLSTRESEDTQECYRAVTKDTPRRFVDALRHPIWGDPARDELKTLDDETGCIVPINADLAIEHIKAGAEVLTLIPVYEEKIKEGKLVHKVRLVADGSKHNVHSSTYSPTPSKEELFILLYIFAVLDLDFYHIDEKRAFLNAKKQDERPRLAKIPSINQFYEILGALYGTRDAPRDYNDHSAKILINDMGCKRLHFCSCIYVKLDKIVDIKGNTKKIFLFVFQFADDYLMGGNRTDYTENFIEDYRKIVKTTPPIKNPEKLLGLELIRDRPKKIIKITMESKITEVYDNYLKNHPSGKKKRHIPLPKDKYIIKESDFEILPENKKEFLNAEERNLYLILVGSLIWIQGLRLDIIFAVLYLSWNTKSPRQHHLDMAYYCIGYLYTTKNIPLVLGGPIEFQRTVYSDASLGTGPKGRSPIAVVSKFNPSSGAISASTSAGQSPYLSSFECELDGVTKNFKTQSRLKNILDEIDIQYIYDSMGLSEKYNQKGQSYSDNEAMINFIKGDAITKGIRHMELRLWYTRDEYKKEKSFLDHMPGADIPADPCTKPTCVSAHRKHTINIMGLGLTGEEYFAEINPVT